MSMYTKVLWGNGNVQQWWDDTTRTYHEYNEAGAEVETRPYSPLENAEADERAAQAVQDQNQKTIEQALAESLVLLQAIIDTPNADMTASAWKGYVKDLARVQRRLIRLVIRRFDGAA